MFTIWAVLFSSWLQEAANKDGPRLCIDEVISALDEQIAALNETELAFTASHFQLTDGSPPGDLSTLEPNTVENWTVLFSREAYRITREYAAAPSSDLLGCRNVFDFDGSLYRMEAFYPRLSDQNPGFARQGSISTTPHESLHGNLIFRWLDHPLCGERLASIIANATDNSVEIEETNGIVRLSVDHRSMPHMRWEVLYQRVDDRVRILSVIWTVHDPVTAEIGLQVHMGFGDWDQCLPLGVPVATTFTWVATYPKGADFTSSPQWGASRIALKSATRRRLADCDPVEFAEALGRLPRYLIASAIEGVREGVTEIEFESSGGARCRIPLTH
jgi:hypothetical protein